jgi:hypothetical protein
MSLTEEKSVIALISFFRLEVLKFMGRKSKLNAADLVPVQGNFQRSPNYQLSRLIEQITLMSSKMVLLFLFLHLMKVQYTVISDPDPRLVVNP